MTHGKMNSRARGSFLSLETNQTIRWEKKRKEKKRKNERKGKRKEKKKKGGKGKENEEKEKKKKKKTQNESRESRAWRGGERKKKEHNFPSRSPANRQSKCIRARDKVGPRDESYAWVP